MFGALVRSFVLGPGPQTLTQTDSDSGMFKENNGSKVGTTFQDYCYSSCSTKLRTAVIITELPIRRYALSSY